jgi:hypothetical protein
MPTSSGRWKIRIPTTSSIRRVSTSLSDVNVSLPFSNTLTGTQIQNVGALQADGWATGSTPVLAATDNLVGVNSAVTLEGQNYPTTNNNATWTFGPQWVPTSSTPPTSPPSCTGYACLTRPPGERRSKPSSPLDPRRLTPEAVNASGGEPPWSVRARGRQEPAATRRPLSPAPLDQTRLIPAAPRQHPRPDQPQQHRHP